MGVTRWINRPGPVRLELALEGGASIVIPVERWRYRRDAENAWEWELFPHEDSDFIIDCTVLAIVELPEKRPTLKR